MKTAIEELEVYQEGNGLKLGEKAPNLKLLNATGRMVELYEQLKDRAIVLTFYRGDWCPYCNMELRVYQQIVEDIHNQGAELIAVSPQTPDQSLTTRKKQFRISCVKRQK